MTSRLGKYIQTEQNYNADFVYPMNVDMFYSDLNVAFGAEYRVETFEIRQGPEDGWRAGDYAFQNVGRPHLPRRCDVRRESRRYAGYGLHRWSATAGDEHRRQRLRWVQPAADR